MMRSACLPVVFSLLGWPALGTAQEKFTVQLQEAAKGLRQTVERRLDQKASIKLSDDKGNQLKATDEETVERFTYEETILEKPDRLRKPTQLRRRYEVAEAKTGMDTQTLPYQGKTLDIQKKDERYHFRIEGGGELAGKDAKFLDDEFNQNKGEDLDFNKAMLPKQPVRLLESWTPDTKALIANLESGARVEMDATKAKTTATLLRAFKKEGRQYGIIQMKLEFPLKAFKLGDMKLPLREGAMMLVEATMASCIDGSLVDNNTVFTATITAQADLDQGGKKFPMTMNMSMKGEEKEREKK